MANLHNTPTSPFLYCFLANIAGDDAPARLLASAVKICLQTTGKNNNAAAECILQLDQDFGPFSKWDTSRIVSMAHMFQQCATFNADISKWNVSRVTNMGGAFQAAQKFNADLSKWDVSSVTSMKTLFKSASSFNSDISKWHVSNVKNMHGMFWNAIAFNRDISKWNVARVKDFENMFSSAKNFSQRLCGAAWVAARKNIGVNKMSMFSRSSGSISSTVCDECVDSGRGTCGSPRHVGDSICDDKK